MKKTVNLSSFRDAFYRMDSRKDHFSYEGLEVLYEWLIELESSGGYEVEFDVVSLCCEFAEMSLDQLNDDYFKEYKNIEEVQEDFEGFLGIVKFESMFEEVKHDNILIQCL